MAVFVLDTHKEPLMPCSEKRARLLLGRGRARVHRLRPFAIRLVDRRKEDSVLQPLRVGIDPGSKVTGLALCRESEAVDRITGEVATTRHTLFLAELQHRGQAIRDALTQRAGYRRRRRNSHLRHRAARFDNRTRPPGWLAPSLQHRVDTTVAWVSTLSRLAPISAIDQELVRFDMQSIQNPDISGVEYQQGTLAGYEVREYLLEKWHRQCAYCGAQNVPLQIEHVQPRSVGGSDRVSNLTLACGACNAAKGARDVRVFLAHKPAVLKRIPVQATAPLKDAAAVNATRWALFNALKGLGLPVEAASGGRTKWNRTRLGVPKAHALDALCVGRMDAVAHWQVPTLAIKATGRGSYQRTRVDRFGFARGFLMRTKSVRGFQTGDHVSARVPDGKKVGLHIGRVAVRASGTFNIQTPHGIVQGISHRHCRMLQRADGYGYQYVAPHHKESENGGHAARAALSLPGQNAGVSRAK
ncbi:MAG: HNH endonuclease [Rhodanobacter sp.]|nr:MAG: HNH endonuclease [Rhodanobacter sp.]TAL99466.1 MAG: HNH endonuclease [Rhodanobacter sp.]TAM40930.1 MAG: HNH endonuclease [Rhodanobacter sp.]TAN25670.1 MAG: HNH endonuclease [Rhodanobacter sp.]